MHQQAKSIRWGIAILISIFLGACNNTPMPITAQIIATPTVPATPSPNPPSPPQTPTRKVVPTRLRTATSTPRSTFTSLPVITEIRNETPLAMVVYEEYNESPSGNWKAIFIHKSPTGPAMECHIEAQVARTDGTQAWILEDKWVEELIGCAHFKLFQWSQDENYLYYLEQPSSDACFTSTPTLKRANLQTGRVIEIALGDNLTISPNEQLLAYTDISDRSQIKFAIENLETTLERALEFEAEWADGVTWSPDNSTIALTLVNHPCDYWQTSIAIVDSQTMSASILLPLDSGLRVVGWTDDHTIHLKDVDGKDWQLDIFSQELTGD